MSEATFDTKAMKSELTVMATNIREVFAPVDEAALAYRRQLERDGWSRSTAETVAAQYYATMLGGIQGDGKPVAMPKAERSRLRDVAWGEPWHVKVWLASSLLYCVVSGALVIAALISFLVERMVG